MSRKNGQVMGFFSVKNGKKLCQKCNLDKDVENFSIHAYKTGGGNKSKRIKSHCKECIAIERKQKYERNTEKYREANRVQRQRHKDRNLKYSREYRRSDKGRAKKAECQRLRDAGIRKQALSLTDEERQKIDSIYLEAKRIQNETGIVMHVDHIIPISKGGKHHPDNLQILSMVENISKGNRI